MIFNSGITPAFVKLVVNNCSRIIDKEIGISPNLKKIGPPKFDAHKTQLRSF